MPQSPPPLITVEVAYALPHAQSILSLQVLAGTTAQEVIVQSGILQLHENMTLHKLTLGIFGKKINHDTVVQAGDRIEIYRPLLANPKEARRQRAAAKNGKVNSK